MKTNKTTCRTYWEDNRVKGIRRLVREYLDSAGNIVRWEVVRTETYHASGK